MDVLPGSGSVAGYGPLFIQGPSSAMSTAEVEIDVNILKHGSYTFTAWIMIREPCRKESRLHRHPLSRAVQSLTSR